VIAQRRVPLDPSSKRLVTSSDVAAGIVVVVVLVVVVLLVVVVWATVVVVVVVGGTVGAVSLLEATPPNVVQVPETQRSVEPASLSIISTGEREVSPRLKTAKPSLYVPVISTLYVDVCQPVAP
jgi:hypothetical protein